MKETDYGNDFAKYGCLLDTGNPAFYVKDYSQRGKSLSADYRIEPVETAEEYWQRVRKQIGNKYK